jgi:hypothetical protein
MRGYLLVFTYYEMKIYVINDLTVVDVGSFENDAGGESLLGGDFAVSLAGSDFDLVVGGEVSFAFSSVKLVPLLDDLVVHRDVTSD